MKTCTSLMILVLLLNAICGSTAAVAQTPSSAESIDYTRLTQSTDVTTRIMRCDADDDAISFTVRPRLLRGRVAWVLLDPAGQIRWSSQARAPYWFGQTRRFEPMAGAWKLKVAVVEASGEYRTTWQAD